MNHQTQELVWQGKEEGLQAVLVAADEAIKGGDTIGAHCLRASAYHSRYAALIPRNIGTAFTMFRLARWHAYLAYYTMHRQGYAGVTHGQFDVVATILLKSWLWHRPNPKLAHDLLKRGLALSNVPPHARALMIIGLAESRYLRRRRRECPGLIEQALLIEKDLAFEDDYDQARRQFARVLRRAGVLQYRLGSHEQALSSFARAKTIVELGSTKSADQAWKQRLSFLYMYIPNGFRWLVPT